MFDLSETTSDSDNNDCLNTTTYTLTKDKIKTIGCKSNLNEYLSEHIDKCNRLKKSLKYYSDDLENQKNDFNTLKTLIKQIDYEMEKVLELLENNSNKNYLHIIKETNDNEKIKKPEIIKKEIIVRNSEIKIENMEMAQLP